MEDVIHGSVPVASVDGVQQLLEAAPVLVASGATSWTDVVAAVAGVVAALAGVVAALAALGTLLATAAAVAVAVLAARYTEGRVDGARALLDDARTQRREQARPDVVVHADLDPAYASLVDVIIRNLGATGAHEVRTACSPPLTRVGVDGPEP